MSNKKLKVLIDCDPGHDDAIAIFLAASHPERFDILGVTTVAGNQTLANVTNNAGQILEKIGSTLPLASGQSSPLIKPHAVSLSAHGDSGLDGPESLVSTYPVVTTNAITFMYEQIKNTGEKVTIIALGPLTNVALLLKVYPEIIPNIEQISLMGGGITKGNTSAAAEFNIYLDPEAAKIVYESGVHIIMAGLDVTEKAYVTLSEIKSLEGKGGIHQYVFELLSFYNEAGKAFGFEDSALHDACSVAYLLDPTIFSGSTKKVSIVTDDGINRGQTLADNRMIPREGSDIFVLEDVDREAFKAYIFEAFKILDQQ